MSETKWTLISKQMVQKTKTKKSCDILEIIFNVYTDFFFNVCTLFTPLVENTQSFLFLPSVVFGSTSVSTTMVPQLTLYLNSKLTYYLEIGPLGSNLLFGLQQRERKKKRGRKGGGISCWARKWAEYRMKNSSCVWSPGNLAGKER